MSDNEITRIIEEDKERTKYRCSYSISSSESCSSADGKFVCEVMKRIQRNCPGERPVTIFSKNEKNDSNESDIAERHQSHSHSHSSSSSHSMDFNSGGGQSSMDFNFGGGGGIFGAGVDPFSFAKKFLEFAEGDAFPPFPRHTPPPPPPNHRLPPHHHQPPHRRIDRPHNNDTKPRGEITGSVEEV